MTRTVLTSVVVPAGYISLRTESYGNPDARHTLVRCGAHSTSVPWFRGEAERAAESIRQYVLASCPEFSPSCLIEPLLRYADRLLHPKVAP